MPIGLLKRGGAAPAQQPPSPAGDVQLTDSVTESKIQAQTANGATADVERGGEATSVTPAAGPSDENGSARRDQNGNDQPASSTEGLVEASLWDLVKQWALLGWTAFGGPSAHIALFQKIFVEKLRWISNTVFLELLALSQCIPGPSSTQVSFAIGVIKQGMTGSLITGVLFQYPGFIIMSLVGVGAANFLKNPAPWLRGLLQGLGAVGVALVAGSAVSLTYATCKERVTMAINGASAVVAYYYSAAWVFPVLIILGGLITLYTKRNEDLSVKNADEHVEKFGVNKVWGAVLIVLWAAILIVCVCLSHYVPNLTVLSWWAVFFRTGSVIFGGGQVVLPMMYNAIVQQDCTYITADGANKQVCVDSPDSWMSTQDFYTGLAVVQAMPGPLFNIAAYQGAVIANNAGIFPLVGIIVCWVGLFAPGIMLIYGILPYWAAFRHFKIYRRMLPGLNAAAVGLVVTAVFQLTFKLRQTSPFPDATICIGIIGFVLADVLKFPAPLAIVAGGVLGIIAWATHMH